MKCEPSLKSIVQVKKIIIKWDLYLTLSLTIWVDHQSFLNYAGKNDRRETFLEKF